MEKSRVVNLCFLNSGLEFTKLNNISFLWSRLLNYKQRYTFFVTQIKPVPLLPTWLTTLDLTISLWKFSISCKTVFSKPSKQLFFGRIQFLKRVFLHVCSTFCFNLIFINFSKVAILNLSKPPTVCLFLHFSS
jgi:hypothetical protein